jgi:hypothetical protein
MEKTYTFHISTFGGEEEIHVKESELTEDQRELIFGQVVQCYEQAPDSVKMKFLVWALKQPSEITC